VDNGIRTSINSSAAITWFTVDRVHHVATVASDLHTINVKIPDIFVDIFKYETGRDTDKRVQNDFTLYYIRDFKVA